jgi:copper chaperone NosL
VRAATGAALVACVLVVTTACLPGPPQPAALDTRAEACASCRMAVSEARFAGQIVAPGELPRFFDDVGCLADFVKAGRAPAGAVAFVADHRTREWVRADRASYARVTSLETPMGSHLVAHADRSSREQDEAARTGARVTLAEVFGPKGPPAGEQP